MTLAIKLGYVAGATAVCLGGGNCDTGLPTAAANSSALQHLLQIVFGIFGAIAVLMIVIAGLHFIEAQGDPSKIAKARNTIIYALVGLVIAISAEIIVSFVLGKF
jgi:hypothetical protein